jgi:ubiquinone/menaquinone biosynthesis C-methylase UbiE
MAVSAISDVTEARLGLRDILRNEADMAFRRRVRTVFHFLEPRPGDRILDSGCGHGFYLKALAEIAHPRTAGVEYRAMWIEHARRELSGTGAHLVRGDVCSLPFASESFDKAIMSEVLEHVPDDMSALREAWRVLRPGGTIAITVPHANYPLLWDPVNKILERVLGTHLPSEPLWLGGIWADHFRLYRPEEIVERLAQSGFEVVEVHRLTHYCIPFAHHLFYGLGKALLLSGWLPRSFRNRADRFRYREGTSQRFHPMNVILRLLAAVDARNERRQDYSTYLNIGVKAVRR